MQFEFDEKIDTAIQKSIKSALRHFKEQLKEAQGTGNSPTPPSYEEFNAVVEEMMESKKQSELKRLRTPSLRDLFERTWLLRLHNYSTQSQLRDTYDALIRRY